MRLGLEYAPHDVILPFKGLNTVVEPTVLSPSFTPRARNMYFTNGIVTKREGSIRLGGVLATPIMQIAEFETSSGTKHLLAFTTTKQYRYNSATSAWVDITASGDDWAGDEDDVIDYAIGWDDDGKYIYITNGVDMPRRWEGTGNFEDIDGAGGGSMNLASFVTCKAVSIFNSYLLLGNVTLSSGNPQAVYWSDTSDFSEFNEGASGSNVLNDAIGEILTIKKMGYRLVVYTEGGSITEIAHIGLPAVFDFRTLLQDFNIISARCVVPVVNTHLILTYDNIFMFDGTAAPRPIAKGIKNLIQNTIISTYVNRCFGVFDETRNRVYFVIRTGTYTHLALMLEYDLFNISQMTWAEVEFRSLPTAGGVFSRDATLTWDDEVGTWDEAIGPWNSGKTQGGAPLMVLGLNKRVLMYDETTLLEDTKAISAYWDTPDFVVPGAYLSQNARWLEVEYEAKNGTIYFQYSTNGGASWVSLSGGLAKVLDSTFTTYRHYFNVVAQKIRFRVFTSTGTGQFHLKWLRVWYKPREES